MRVAGIELAQPGDLTFLANPRYHRLLKATRASAVILGPHDAVEAPCAVLRSENPRLSFAHAIGLFEGPVARPSGIDPLSSIAPDAQLGPGVSIGPFVTISAGAAVGARTVVFPHVVIGPGARLGDECLVHAHVSIRERVVIGNRIIL